MINRCHAIKPEDRTLVGPGDCACGACETGVPRVAYCRTHPAERHTGCDTGCLFCGADDHDQPQCPVAHPVYVAGGDHDAQ